MDKETGKIMGSGVVGGGDEDKTGKVAHGVHEVCVALVVFDSARGPKVDMENIKWAAKGP